jgi:hypothetical protein
MGWLKPVSPLSATGPMAEWYGGGSHDGSKGAAKAHNPGFPAGENNWESVHLHASVRIFDFENK